MLDLYDPGIPSGATNGVKVSNSGAQGHFDVLQQRGAQQVLRGVQGQGVAQLGAADDAGFLANQVARIGAGPVALGMSCITPCGL